MDKLNFSHSFIYKTGERIIPGSVSNSVLSEHYARYFFAEKLCHGKRVLNIASGAGYGSEVLGRTAKEIYNVDISEQLIAYGNLKYGNYKNHFLVMDASYLDFPDNFFDVIVTFETFEHLSGHRSFLDECRRVLKKSGRIILSMPNKNVTSPDLAKPMNPFHFKEWTLDEFKKIISKKFSIDGLYGQNFTSPQIRSSFFSSSATRNVIGFLYDKTPAAIFKFVKKYILKYKNIALNRIKIHPKDKIVSASDADFYVNNRNMSFAIIIVVLRKTF